MTTRSFTLRTFLVLLLAVGVQHAQAPTPAPAAAPVPADFTVDHADTSAAWAVFDLLRLLGKPAVHAMAGESQESLAREFPYLTDDQAKAISNYFASLAS